jgi:predicted DNA-binding transcriptional regulator AlpA
MLPPPKRPQALADAYAPRAVRRADVIEFLRQTHLKASDLQLLFACSRPTMLRLIAREDFPAPLSLSDDGHNLRYVYDEIIAYRDSHRRQIRQAKLLTRSKPKPDGKAALLQGLEALQLKRSGGGTRFR